MYDPFKTRSSSFQISFCICTQIARGSESGMRLAPPAIRTIYQRPPPHAAYQITSQVYFHILCGISDGPKFDHCQVLSVTESVMLLRLE